MPSSLSPPNRNTMADNVLTAGATPNNRVYAIDRDKVSPETLKAAQGMEAMFLDYMMKVMRQTVPKNEMDMDSPASEVYRSMLDSENAQKAARLGGIGLTDQIVAFLQAQQYNQSEAQSRRQAIGQAINPSTGGTRESQSNQQSERSEFRSVPDTKEQGTQ